jgi:hypothetical protein
VTAYSAKKTHTKTNQNALDAEPKSVSESQTEEKAMMTSSGSNVWGGEKKNRFLHQVSVIFRWTLNATVLRSKLLYKTNVTEV